MNELETKKTKKSLEERGLKQGSYFKATLEDGTEITEHEYNWNDFATQKRVDYAGGKKTVFTSNEKMTKIEIFHDDHYVTIEVPDDCEVYQAVRSEALFTPNGNRSGRIVGRAVGLVRNNEVVEEYFINVMSNSITGYRNY